MPNWKKLIVSGSNASLSNLTVNNAVTASYFVGDGSALTNITAEVTQQATVADTFTSSLTKSVTHNFGTKNVLVSVYNDSDQLILPATITTATDNTVDITFDTLSTGRVVVAKGGHILSGSAFDSTKLNGQPGSFYLDYTNATNTRFEQDITGSTSYLISHNLNEDFPIVQVYDTATKQQVIPGIISASNANEVLLEFDTTFNGKVIIKR